MLSSLSPTAASFWSLSAYIENLSYSNVSVYYGFIIESCRPIDVCTSTLVLFRVARTRGGNKELYGVGRFGTEVSGRSETAAGFRGGAPENFSKVQVSAIKNNYTFWQKHLFIWVTEGVREINFF